MGVAGQRHGVRALHVCGNPGRHEPDRPLDTGIVRALWLSYDDIAARRDLHRNPLVLQSLDDYRAGTRWPLGVIANL